MQPDLSFNSSNSSIRQQWPPTLAMALFVGGLGCALFYNGRNINLYALAGILVFASCAFSVCFLSRTRLVLGPSGLLLIAFVAWNALAITWSSVPYMSMVDVGVLVCGVEAYIIWRVWNRDETVLPTGFLLVAIGCAFAIIMLAQFFWGFQPRAMLLNPNSAAGFLNFLWPFAAVAWLDAERETRYRLLWLGATFVLMTALLLDGSRGAMIGAASGLLVVSLAGSIAIRDQRATLMLVAACAAALVTANLLGAGAIGSGATSLADPALAGTSRFTIWQATWQMVQENPWLGYGPGVFWLAYPAYRAAGDGSSGYYVHNDYLEFWIETGITGLALTVTLGLACIWLFVAVLRRYRRADVTRANLRLAAASFAGMVGVACHSFFTYSFQMIPFILVLGILIAEFERATQPYMGADLRVPSMRRILPATGLLALTVLVVGHYTRTAVSISYVKEGSRLIPEGNYVEAADSFATVNGLWPQLDGAWYLHAKTLLEAMRRHEGIPERRRIKLVEQAMAMLDRAERHNPHRAETPMIRGLLRGDHPDLTSGSAFDALRESIELDPRLLEARYALSELYARSGDYDRAVQVLETGMEIAKKAGMDGTMLARRLRSLRQRSSSGSGSSRQPAPGVPRQPTTGHPGAVLGKPTVDP